MLPRRLREPERLCEFHVRRRRDRCGEPPFFLGGIREVRAGSDHWASAHYGRTRSAPKCALTRPDVADVQHLDGLIGSLERLISPSVTLVSLIAVLII